MSSIDYSSSLIWIPPLKITCLSEKLRTEFTSPTAKSTSPMLWDTTFFARWEGKTGVPREKPLRTRERTNNKLNPHIRYPGWDLNLGNIGERRVSSPLCHPCSFWELSNQLEYSTVAKIFQVSSVKRKVNSCWVFISLKRFLISCLHDQCMHSVTILCHNFCTYPHVNAPLIQSEHVYQLSLSFILWRANFITALK